MFVQSRLFRGAIEGADRDELDVNFKMTRIETRWSGQLSARIGAGLELQFHPALEGAPEEIVNDAFVELYVTPSWTIRVGQFIKPFGFEFNSPAKHANTPSALTSPGISFPANAIGG